MRSLVAIVILMGAVLLLAAGVNTAGEKKKVTLKGTITCAKCDLKLEKKCATVIVVKGDKKDTVYYFDAESHKKNHGEVCEASKKGTVEGTVSESDDGKKKIITVTKLTYDK